MLKREGLWFALKIIHQIDLVFDIHIIYELYLVIHFLLDLCGGINDLGFFFSTLKPVI